MVEIGHILIVGGGIGGLPLAVALHQRGYAPELIEWSPEWRANGGGIGVLGNGVRMLERLGLDGAAIQAGEVLRSWRFHDARGELLSETDLRVLWGGVGPCVGIERGRLHQVLVAGTADVSTRLGTSVTWLTPLGDRVLVDFSDGSRGEYDLVVGADGIHSAVRALALGKTSPSYAGQVVWRSVVPIRPRGVHGLTVVMGDDCFFGLVPVGGGRTYGFAGLRADEPLDDPLDGRLGRLRERFGHLGGPVNEYLAAVECDAHVRYDAIEWVDLDRWHGGRVVLIGDAAHAGPPHLGQGGCMAMEDGVILAEMLHEADTVEGALDAYEVRRRPRTDWVQEQSRVALRAWLLPPALRNAALRERGDQMMARYGPLLAAP